MKAWVLHSAGDLRLEEREIPKPGTGEALLRVEAVGVCGSDIPRIYDTGAHVHPLIPGHEFAGTVVESADSALLGKRMGVFPLIPCKSCDMCRQKSYEMCWNYNYLGSRCDGAFAEYVRVPVWNLIELPDEVSFETAAMLEPLAVAIHATRRAGVMENDSAVIIGFGTIGMLLAAVLLAQGVRDITVVVNKDFQREKARELGVSTVNYVDAVKSPPTGQVVFECVGKPKSAALVIETAAPGGRVVLVGNPHSDMAFGRNTYWKILRNQLTVLGTWNSSFTKELSDDWYAALELVRKKQELVSRIITHRLPLEGMETGLHIMRDKTQGYGKIMIIGNHRERCIKQI